MGYGHAYYELISYGGSLYAIGGHDGSETKIMERYTPGEGWVRVADMPYANHRYTDHLLTFPYLVKFLDSVQWQMRKMTAFT